MEESARIFGGILFAFLLITAGIINLLLVYALVKGHSEFKKLSFFILTWQLLICDFIALINKLIIAVPTTLAGYQIYSTTFTNAVSLLDRLSFYGMLLFVFILTVNRFLLFIFPSVNEIFFSLPNIYFTVGISWGILVIYLILITIGGCYTSFDAVNDFIYYITCWDIKTRPWWSINILQPAAEGFVFYVPWIMLILYFIIFIDLRFSLLKRLQSTPTLTTTHRRKSEIRILIQSLIISAVLLIQYQAFRNLSKLSKGNPFWSTVTNISVNSMAAVINCIHAIVLFALNKRAKVILINMFSKKQIVNTSSLFVTVIASHRNKQ